jgi:hypothetical protein
MRDFFEDLFSLIAHLTWYSLCFVGKLGEFFYKHVVGFHYFIDIPLYILSVAARVFFFYLSAEYS